MFDIPLAWIKAVTGEIGSTDKVEIYSFLEHPIKFIGVFKAPEYKPAFCVLAVIMN